jgi:hypothetical protein
VLQEELRYHAQAADEDLVVGPGRRIPKSIVRACGSNAPVRLTAVTVTAPLLVVLEREGVIRAEFRVDPIAWERRHPHAIGSMSFSRPVYSEDRKIAGVAYTRLRNGIGGGSFFCLLQRDSSGRWSVMWQETLLIE